MLGEIYRWISRDGLLCLAVGGFVPLAAPPKNRPAHMSQCTISISIIVWLAQRITERVLLYNPQMSGTGSGPSTATTSKCPRRKQQHWLNKEKMRKQRVATACAAEGADPVAGAQNPGECALI
jgi:hypothetical protein